jgi:hypothetical protein
MFTATQQEQIIAANREAFEQLARQWRNPQTGECEPDLKVALRQMVCDYFSVHGCSGGELYGLIASLQKAALEQDFRLELTEEEISAETRTKLKNLVADPDPGRWYWDDGTWAWELSLRNAQEDVDAGYVAIIPVKNGCRFKYKLEPPFSHDQWAIKFVDAWPFDCPLIPVKGSLEEAKRTLDQLLRADTPEIPNQLNYHQLSSTTHG